MNVKRILFPTDFSHCNDAALKYASTLAADANALLYIVHVHERQDISAAMGEAGFAYPSAYDTADSAEVRDRLTKVVPTVAEVAYDHHFLTGSPLREILKFAEREHVDLIVMGSHGRTGLSRLLMGSIAEGVMRKALCPVLIVKQPTGQCEPTDEIGSYVAQQ